MVENYVRCIWQAAILNSVLILGTKIAIKLILLFITSISSDLSELENLWCSTLINVQKNDLASLTFCSKTIVVLDTERKKTSPLSFCCLSVLF